mmetsp:Transcript_73675/g.159435  ORF Transcript_73675/g.159435 Transcript_73675/m.159435 type:complete len:82 (-) Transcript_73675:1521-1766(-)
MAHLAASAPQQGRGLKCIRRKEARSRPNVSSSPPRSHSGTAPGYCFASSRGTVSQAKVDQTAQYHLSPGCPSNFDSQSRQS